MARTQNETIAIDPLGKSTLAKVLFNNLASDFPLSAIVEISQGDGDNKTAHHLAAALKRLGANTEESEGESVLSKKLAEYVKDKKVLFVLDNVWTTSQLNYLLAAAWGKGSVIIVTSRSSTINSSQQVCTWLQRCNL